MIHANFQASCGRNGKQLEQNSPTWGPPLYTVEHSVPRRLSKYLLDNMRGCLVATPEEHALTTSPWEFCLGLLVTDAEVAVIRFLLLLSLV